MTPPRKPENVTRRVIRIGIPATEKVDTWISVNQLLKLDAHLAKEAATVLRTAPKWIQHYGVHAKLDPVLG